MLLREPVDDLIAEVGHDGSEIIFPDLPGTAKRRGFSYMDLAKLCTPRGYGLTYAEPFFAAGVDDAHVRVYDYTDFVIKLMSESPGILVGLNRAGNMHAWASNMDGQLYDPSIGVYKWRPGSAFPAVRCFWALI